MRKITSSFLVNMIICLQWLFRTSDPKGSINKYFSFSVLWSYLGHLCKVLSKICWVEVNIISFQHAVEMFMNSTDKKKCTEITKLQLSWDEKKVMGIRGSIRQSNMQSYKSPFPSPICSLRKFTCGNKKNQRVALFL